jgi:hypothetical protein
VLPPPWAFRLRSRFSTSPDRPEPRRSSDDHRRSVSYRLDTPTSPAVARCQRRLVSTSDDVIALVPRFGTPGRCEVRPEPRRNVAVTARSPPTLPDKRLRVPSERGACRLALHCSTIGSWRCTTETPKGLPGALDPARINARNIQPRRGLPVRRACCHARCGTACKPRRQRNRARPAHGSGEPKLTLSDHQLRSAAPARTPKPTAACATADCTQPIAHMKSETAMLPPPPRQKLR